ncbi:hypothetical protein EGR_07593 [Echinococcus granulosus]|uniref:Uncharacterized protein n=1 Tax=Echinococcus granulosus TaxID=6210 RepID=W6UHL5_ECHGR|nr:hypothetical protein EGR_07593 [Echinococcus granulosus]EUB57582.1 hypothetical protein EGR_07593 [Echinococcus granulosus]
MPPGGSTTYPACSVHLVHLTIKQPVKLPSRSPLPLFWATSTSSSLDGRQSRAPQRPFRYASFLPALLPLSGDGQVVTVSPVQAVNIIMKSSSRTQGRVTVSGEGTYIYCVCQESWHIHPSSVHRLHLHHLL